MTGIAVPRLSDAFDEALERGELLIQRCDACGRHNMYPRYACPFCYADDLGWSVASGLGSLYSVAVLRVGSPRGFEEELPYGLGVVKLDEGVQLLGRLWPDDDGGWDSYVCDGRVEFAPHAPAPGRRPAAWFRAVR
jgi:uncharacterized OB-fold protein